MHIPVLKNKVLEYLSPKPNQNFVDCTFGQGGHTVAILEAIKPQGKVLALEADPELHKKFQTQDTDKFPGASRLVLINNSYSNLKKVVKERNFGPISGVLIDLGLSSWHIKESGRGFTFQKDEPLDMRYNPEINPLTASDIVNTYPEEELTKILREYGEEKLAKPIAKKIIQKRQQKPLRTTLDLVEIIWSALPSGYQRKKIHPATKTFQALRIRVNSELQNLEQGLLQAVDVLEAEGKLVVISYQSIEDAIVKRFFKRGKQINILEILTKKPISPGQEEIEANPAARSAKLRAAKKLV